MNLDPEVIAFGVVSGHLGQGLAITEANLQKDWAVVSEQGWQVQGPTWLPLDAVSRPQRGEGALLGLGQPALTQHIAADRAPMGCSFRR